MPIKRALLWGAIFGTMYGVLLRISFGNLPGWAIPPRARSTASVMTIAFLVFGPLAIGYLMISVAERSMRRKIWERIVMPWLPVMLSVAVSVSLNLEGLICVAFALPMMTMAASLGGMLAGAIADRRRESGFTLSACVALLPFLVAPIETHLHAPTEFRQVATSIRILAPTERVWTNIERVPPIQPSELPASWTERIGFPRPIEATLSFAGVGGVRHASFAGGLVFLETITEWKPNEVLRFSIRANTEQIPPATLDEHVTIGGPYFDVLKGEYRIEPAAADKVILHLTSVERLSTDFNGYAAFWSDAVMHDIQNKILRVIKNRCERPGEIANVLYIDRSPAHPRYACSPASPLRTLFVDDSAPGGSRNGSTMIRW